MSRRDRWLRWPRSKANLDPDRPSSQAGNKSLWGFRSDIGVPGYTGFCPTHVSIKVPHKGFDHTGRPVDTQFKEQQIAATAEPEKVKISE